LAAEALLGPGHGLGFGQGVRGEGHGPRRRSSRTAAHVVPEEHRSSRAHRCGRLGPVGVSGAARVTDHPSPQLGHHQPDEPRRFRSGAAAGEQHRCRDHGQEVDGLEGRRKNSTSSETRATTRSGRRPTRRHRPSAARRCGSPTRRAIPPGRWRRAFFTATDRLHAHPAKTSWFVQEGERAAGVDQADEGRPRRGHGDAGRSATWRATARVRTAHPSLGQQPRRARSTVDARQPMPRRRAPRPGRGGRGGRLRTGQPRARAHVSRPATVDASQNHGWPPGPAS